MMNRPIELAPTTVARLKALAEPLVDTFDSVVNRAIDALEAQLGKGAQSGKPSRVLNAAAPPNLAHTTVHSIILNGTRFPPNETYWNHLLLASIREARKHMNKQQVKDLILVNSLVGKKEDEGYKYLEDVGISVQGQDANGAWKATYHILDALKLPVEVVFSWRDNAKAAAPGERATFVLSWK